jgi:hypothetical protein
MTRMQSARNTSLVCLLVASLGVGSALATADARTRPTRPNQQSCLPGMKAADYCENDGDHDHQHGHHNKPR